VGVLDIAAHVAGAIVVALALGFLPRNARFHAAHEGHRMVLRYGTPVRVFWWLLLCAVLVGWYVGVQKSNEGPVSQWIVLEGFAVVMLPLFLEFFLVRIEFDDHAIYTRSPWRSPRRIPWSEITSYSFSRANRWHIFRTRSMGAVRLSVFLSGIGSFMAEAKRRQLVGICLPDTVDPRGSKGK